MLVHGSNYDQYASGNNVFDNIVIFWSVFVDRYNTNGLVTPVVDARKLVQCNVVKHGIVYTAGNPFAASQLYFFTLSDLIVINFIDYMGLVCAC